MTAAYKSLVDHVLDKQLLISVDDGGDTDDPQGTAMDNREAVLEAVESAEVAEIDVWSADRKRHLGWALIMPYAPTSLESIANYSGDLITDWIERYQDALDDDAEELELSL